MSNIKSLKYEFESRRRDNGRHTWGDLHLGTMLNLYLIQHSDVSQAQLANELGTTPMSISRKLKAKKSAVKNEWKARLAEYICAIDTDAIRQQLQVIDSISCRIRFDHLKEELEEVVSQLLKTTDSANEYEPYRFSDIGGMYLYRHIYTKKLWSFDVVSNGYSVKTLEDVINKFNSNWVTEEERPQVNRQTLICGEKNIYYDICGMCSRFESELKSGEKCCRTVVLVDADENAILSVYTF